MARSLSKKSRKHGFTLVELLIVVAIIGILSTVAVPTFRRMIAKSKKTEAKVNLGGLYTAEQAFLAEYGAFGNNLQKIGFQSDGNAATDIYTVGFPQGDCTHIAAASILPGTTTALGQAINQVFPSYYIDPSTTGPNPGFGTKVGATNSKCAAAAGANGIPASDADGTAIVINVYSQTGTTDTFNRFVASATGPIWPGVNRSSTNLTDYDVWTIDNNRSMRNTQDGTK